MLDVFQAQAGKGKLLVSGLNLLSTNVESVYLLDQFIKYAHSSNFQPSGTFNPEQPGTLAQSGLGNPVIAKAIAVFNATTKVLNQRGDQTNAIDRNLSTFSYLTPSFTTSPQIVAFDLGNQYIVNRLRVAKMGNSDGVDGIDHFDLSILYSTNTGTLNTRTYQLVNGLTSGYYGQELVNADSVNPNGTVQRECQDYASQGFYSLTFNPVTATTVAIQFNRSAGDPYPYSHYAVFEAEVYPAPSGSSIQGIAVFDAATKALNQRGDQNKAIDGSIGTFSYLTPSSTTGAQVVAFDLGSGAPPENRLRVAKLGNSDGISGIDNFDLSILYSTNTGALNSRTYQLVSGLASGFYGQELINADSVNPNGTVQREHQDYATQGFYSLTFNPVPATAIAIQFNRSSGDAPWCNYGVYEAQIYPVAKLTDPSIPGLMVMTWPSTLAGYILECSPTLGSTAIWQSVGQLPIVANGNNYTVLPETNSAMFFRLHQQ